MLANLTTFLIGWAQYVAVLILNFLVDVANATLDGIVAFATFCATLMPTGRVLPTLPTLPSGSVWEFCLKGLNWFFPISFIAAATLFALGAAVAYALIAPVLRWIKLLK